MFAVRSAQRYAKFSEGSRRRFSSILSKENIPTIGFCVGITALSVQVWLLYPWHSTLSKQFDDLQVTTFWFSTFWILCGKINNHYWWINLQKEIENMGRITTDVTVKLERVREMEVEVKTKEKKILAESERMLASQIAVRQKLDTLISLVEENGSQVN